MAGDSPTSKRYGRLTAVAFHSRNKHSKPLWTFRCDCGRELIAQLPNVINGKTRSCGCLRSEFGVKQGKNNLKHGMSFSPEYLSWKSMIARCRNPNATGYERYGGRGINICERWLTFANFFEDMGPRPPGRSIDRVNNELGYSKANCRWATRSEQERNKRRSAA